MPFKKITDSMAQRDPNYSQSLDKNKKKSGSGWKKLRELASKNAKSNSNAIWNQGKGGSGKD